MLKKYGALATILFMAGLGAARPAAAAPTDYYRHVFFDNSNQREVYWPSSAARNGASELRSVGLRLPVESALFRTAPNAIRIEWRSAPGGSWDAQIQFVSFPNRFPDFVGGTLFFWVYSPEPIAAADLPNVMLSDARGGLQVATMPGSFTAPEPLAKFVGDLPGGKWVEVRIPFAKLRSASVYEFRPERLQSLIFHQGRADGQKHVLIVDDVRIDDEPAPGAAPAALPVPEGVSARGYDRHVDVQWSVPAGSAASYYVVYRSTDGAPFVPVGTQRPGVNRYADFIGRPGVRSSYRVAAADWSGRESEPSATVNAAKTGWPARQKFWVATYGNNIPGPEPVLPEELATPVLTLEGEEFPITGGVQGADGPGNSFVYVPSLRAVITGDIVFDHVYFGVPRPEPRANWQKTIDQIAALNPAVVVPGHEGPGATRDMRSIEWMKKYITDWDANVPKSKDAAAMRANVLKQYPGLGMEFTLNDRIATYFPLPSAGK